MTEEQWLNTAGPIGMLEHLYFELNELKIPHPPADLSKRRLRLLTVSCCERFAHLLGEQRSRRALQVGERFADGLATAEERSTSLGEANAAEQEYWRANTGRANAPAIAAHLAQVTCVPTADFYSTRGAIEEVRRLCELIDPQTADRRYRELSKVIRDIFPNPFRPVAFDPRWRTSDVVELARTIYADRAFDRMPVLADALMDAGCEDEQVIAHCRGPGPHVRGCWVVDLVLGKE